MKRKKERKKENKLLNRPRERGTKSTCTHRKKLHGEGVGDFGMGAERNWRPRRDALLYGRAFPG